MTIHPALHPLIASTTLSEAQAAAKDLIFFALVGRGFWVARRGMLTVSIPVTDAMCDDLVAAFADVLDSHAEAFAALG
jgi:glutamate-1-semialdehyde 2,1-aminomutase